MHVGPSTRTCTQVSFAPARARPPPGPPAAALTVPDGHIGCSYQRRDAPAALSLEAVATLFVEFGLAYPRFVHRIDLSSTPLRHLAWGSQRG